MAKLLSDRTAQRLHNVLDIVENLPEAQAQPRRRIRTKSKGGGGAERPFVVITSVIDAATYVGNVLDNPTDLNVTLTDVSILVTGATSNDYSIGATGFCDFVDDFYYLSGGVLG